MKFKHSPMFTWTIAAASAAVLSMALTLSGAQAQDKTYVMKIGTPTVNDTPEEFSRGFAQMVEKDSGGRIKIEVYSASKLGSMPRMIEGMQFGSIECAIIPPEFFVGVDERFEVLATPGLLDSLAHGQRMLAQPDVMKLMLGLGADKGLHGIGLYMALPSTLDARTPIRHVADLKGKKIRVFASKFQTEAFERLGATPVAMSLYRRRHLGHHGLQRHALPGRGQIRDRDKPAGHFPHRRGQQAVVRRSTEGFAGNH
jgi:TRAP-type transport system periplasmic protein